MDQCSNGTTSHERYGRPHRPAGAQSNPRNRHSLQATQKCSPASGSVISLPQREANTRQRHADRDPLGDLLTSAGDHPPAARHDPGDPLVTLAGADDPPVVTAAVVGTNPVIKDSDGTLFCRRDFVLALCNKEGGLTLVESAAPGGSCWLALRGNAQGTGEVGCGLGVVCWRWQQHLPWRLAGRIRQTAKRSL